MCIRDRCPPNNYSRGTQPSYNRKVYFALAGYHTLLRFLRAREYDIPKAHSMYAAHLKWRAENKVDTVLKDFHFTEREHYLQVYPQGYYMTDKCGRPMSIQHLGKVDPKRIKEITTEERMIMYHVQEYERFLTHIAPVCSRVHGKHIDKMFVIMDVKGMQPHHLRSDSIHSSPFLFLSVANMQERCAGRCMYLIEWTVLASFVNDINYAGVTLRTLSGDVRKVIARVTSVMQDHYPETLAKTCIINAPFYFQAVWSVVKTFLQPRTVNKVTLLGTKYMDELTQFVDIENIPEYMGGKCRNTLLDDPGPWNDPQVLSMLGMISEENNEDAAEHLHMNEIDAADSPSAMRALTYPAAHQALPRSGANQSPRTPDVRISHIGFTADVCTGQRVCIHALFEISAGKLSCI